uniref:Ground-like domain-containing protein n=1 Tax=Syphacia muris TaxID=451379 RepID=A0A0N5AWC6_9BILA
MVTTEVLLYLFGVLQLSTAQFFPASEQERCPPPPECPPIPAACINYFNQRQAYLQSRLPIIPQNPTYLQRQSLLNSIQPQIPLDRNLQSVRIPQSTSYLHSVPPTFTPLAPSPINSNPALTNSIVGTNFIPPRQPPLGIPPINPLQTHTINNLANSPFNDCCGRCSMICRHMARNGKAYHQKTTNIKRPDSTCTHSELRTLMAKAITEDPNESKRNILQSVEQEYGGDFHVFCSNDDFTYVTKSNTYCQITKDNVTCYAFQTTPPQQQ